MSSVTSPKTISAEDGTAVSSTLLIFKCTEITWHQLIIAVLLKICVTRVAQSQLLEGLKPGTERVAVVKCTKILDSNSSGVILKIIFLASFFHCIRSKLLILIF